MEKFDLNKVINAGKVAGRDVYNSIASVVYEVPYAEVTKEQRAKAKEWLLHILYSRNDTTIEDTLSGVN